MSHLLRDRLRQRREAERLGISVEDVVNREKAAAGVSAVDATRSVLETIDGLAAGRSAGARYAEARERDTAERLADRPRAKTAGEIMADIRAAEEPSGGPANPRKPPVGNEPTPAPAPEPAPEPTVRGAYRATTQEAPVDTERGELWHENGIAGPVGVLPPERDEEHEARTAGTLANVSPSIAALIGEPRQGRPPAHVAPLKKLGALGFRVFAPPARSAHPAALVLTIGKDRLYITRAVIDALGKDVKAALVCRGVDVDPRGQLAAALAIVPVPIDTPGAYKIPKDKRAIGSAPMARALVAERADTGTSVWERARYMVFARDGYAIAYATGKLGGAGGN